MSTAKLIVVTATVPRFRRAGHSFNDNGAAYPLDYFDADALKQLRTEKKLSVQEMQISEVPEGVDVSHIEAQAPTDKAPVKKASDKNDKAST